MTNAVFYSVCPFGTGTIETGDGTIEITSGVATLSVAQTGNIGAGVCIEYNSVECWIAPNRIAFTSGGTTELLVDTKIAGGTSGATGIVRAIEVNSGTWAGGDAAGWIYFEATTGTWGSSEQINRTKPTSSTNIATTNGSLEGNIGNGNTEFVVKNATGGAASNQTSTSVTSVHHEWASLADFETYFTDGSHINNTSLVTADVVAYACCYYDHVNPTTNPDDNAVAVNFGTTGAANYVQAYTPVGEAESVNGQRHDGKWNTGKYRLECTWSGSGYGIVVNAQYVRVEGLQIFVEGTSYLRSINGIDLDPDTNTNEFWVECCVIRSGDYVSLHGINCGYVSGISGMVAKIYNNVIYDFVNNCGIRVGDSDWTVSMYNNTIHNCKNSYARSSGVFTTINCIGNDSVLSNNWDGVITTSYCCSDVAGDLSGTGDRNGADGTITFEDEGGDDFRLGAGDTNAKDNGTANPGSGPLWRDIVGTERGASWDIGAFEYVSAGPSVSIPVIMHHLRQQGIS